MAKQIVQNGVTRQNDHQYTMIIARKTATELMRMLATTEVWPFGALAGALAVPLSLLGFIFATGGRGGSVTLLSVSIGLGASTGGIN